MTLPKLLVITPIKHIQGVYEKLASFTEVIYLPEATSEEVIQQAQTIDAIYTNPNKSNVFLGLDILEEPPRLRLFVLHPRDNHIDKVAAWE